MTHSEIGGEKNTSASHVTPASITTTKCTTCSKYETSSEVLVAFQLSIAHSCGAYCSNTNGKIYNAHDRIKRPYCHNSSHTF